MPPRSARKRARSLNEDEVVNTARGNGASANKRPRSKSNARGTGATPARRSSRRLSRAPAAAEDEDEQQQQQQEEEEEEEQEEVATQPSPRRTRASSGGGRRVTVESPPVAPQSPSAVDRLNEALTRAGNAANRLTTAIQHLPASAQATATATATAINNMVSPTQQANTRATNADADDDADADGDEDEEVAAAGPSRIAIALGYESDPEWLPAAVWGVSLIILMMLMHVVVSLIGGSSLIPRGPPGSRFSSIANGDGPPMVLSSSTPEETRAELLKYVTNKLRVKTAPIWKEIDKTNSSLVKEKARLLALEGTLDSLETQRKQLDESVESASKALDAIAKSSPMATDLEQLVLTDEEANLSDTKQQIANIRDRIKSDAVAAAAKLESVANSMTKENWLPQLASVEQANKLHASSMEALSSLQSKLSSMPPIPTKQDVDDAMSVAKSEAIKRSTDIGAELVEGDDSTIKDWVKEVTIKHMPLNPDNITITQATQIIKKEIDLFHDTDCSGMIDYAWNRAGARVHERAGYTSATYSQPGQGIAGMLYIKKSPKDFPEIAISKGSDIGECWAFGGSEGNITIKLANPVVVTHVTVLHANSKVTPDMRSAPKGFTMFGYSESDSSLKQPINLGHGRYDADDAMSCQTFPMNGAGADGVTKMSHVTMAINSNHGRDEYTCLYRIMVHSAP